MKVGRERAGVMGGWGVGGGEGRWVGGGGMRSESAR